MNEFDVFLYFSPLSDTFLFFFLLAGSSFCIPSGEVEGFYSSILWSRGLSSLSALRLRLEDSLAFSLGV